MKRREIYQDKVLQKIPYLLSHLNRDSASGNFGSFDRAYWAWGNKDYSNADHQRGVYPLSLLYSNDFEGNPYFENDNILRWIEAALSFWIKIQNGNGSFNQWYPYEYSVGTTAFTLYPVTESYFLLKDRMDVELKERLKASFRKGADFILRNDEKHGFISNHQAGMALALSSVYTVTSEEKYRKKSEEIVSRIIENQSEEGWYSEYGGADPGYESLGIYYLSNLWKRSKDPTLLDSLKRSLEFYLYLVKPNKTTGGIFGSRNTELFFPSGFEILKVEIPVCEDIINFFMDPIEKNNIPTIDNIDFYNFIPLLDSYASAVIESGDAEYDPGVKFPLTEIQNGIINFDRARICIFRKRDIYSILGISKGGVIEVYKGEDLIYLDDGYLGKTGSGTKVSSQKLNLNCKYSINGNEVRLEQDFYILPDQQVTPFKNLVLRSGTSTFGRIGFFNKLIKEMLAKILISGLKKYPVKLTRNIVLEDDHIEVTDILKGNKLSNLEYLHRTHRFFTVFMGSARYFSSYEIKYNAGRSENLMGRLNGDEITLKERIMFDGS